MAQNNYYRTRLSALALMSVLALAGCESLGIKDKLKTDEQIDAALKEAATQPVTAPAAEVPPEVAQALMPAPSMRPMPVQDPARTERFDVSAMQVPTAEFFMNLVKGTQYSVVSDPGLDGEISLNMKNVTLEEALDAVSEIYGYEYRRSGNNYLISRPQLQTKMFKVDYLNMKRSGKSTTQVASTGLTEGGSAGNAGINLDTESVEDFWRNLQHTLNVLIGKDVAQASQGQDDNSVGVGAESTEVVDPLGRMVVANPQAGVVIVRALPKDLRLVEAFLGQTQQAIVRQVILEAKVLEVELKDEYQQGVNWSVLQEGGRWSTNASQVGGGSVFGGAGRSEIAGELGRLTPGDFFVPVDSGITSAFGGVFSLALNYADRFSSFMELLESQGKVHVLSSPRVTTMNNQKAVIKVGGDEYFVTNVKSGKVTEGEREGPEIELTAFFSGIALDVTPQIDADNNVTLHVHPTVSEVEEQNKIIDLGDQGTYTLPVATSDVQESDNVVRARSGQIIVIGGLMKERTTDGDASVPGLGDIPGVGNLFKHKLQTRVKRELVILIKPTVVENGLAWNNAAQAARDRIQQMNRPVKKGE